MSIKKLGEMSEELSSGLYDKVEELENYLGNFSDWTRSLKNIEREWVAEELETEVETHIAKALAGLRFLVDDDWEKDIYAAYDGEAFTKEAEGKD